MTDNTRQEAVERDDFGALLIHAARQVVGDPGRYASAGQWAAIAEFVLDASGLIEQLTEARALLAENEKLRAVIDAAEQWCGGDHKLLPRRVQRAMAAFHEYRRSRIVQSVDITDFARGERIRETFHGVVSVPERTHIDDVVDRLEDAHRTAQDEP